MNEAIPSDVSMSDVWQWLGRGWFNHIRSPGDPPCPARIEEGRDDGYRVVRTDGYECEFVHSHCYPHWPVCGAVNMGGYALVVDRQQVRQWRRTYNSRCVLIDIPRKWDVMKRHSDAAHLTPDSVELVMSAFEPTYYTYTRALSLLESGWVSVALNPYLVVAGTEEEQLIYYRSKLTARIIRGQLIPLDPSNKRNRRILKWFDGRVANGHS